MLGLEKAVAGARIRGVAAATIVDVVRVEWIGTDASAATRPRNPNAVAPGAMVSWSHQTYETRRVL
jgi:hypothetical protein